MNIFLLGNGFDLHHDLPTKYINFLNIVDYIKNEKSCDSCSTVGKVFSNPELIKKDETIKLCNEKYNSVYKLIEIDTDSIQELRSLANKNDWFEYMLECYRKNATWIDFEQEISRVCKAFDTFFVANRKRRNPKISREFETIFRCFDSLFKLEVSYTQYSGYYETLNINSDFVININNSVKINESLIVETLYNSLMELAKMLRLYLKIFVDNTVEGLVAHSLIKQNDLFENVDQVFTLNYTNTFAKVYGSNDNITLHIHGNIASDIVLGVQADEKDELEENDSTFIMFKKYYQRSMCGTEYSLNSKINELKQSKDTIKLSIMGHSLDITDRDIIKKLFSVADRIIIYYYGDKRAQGNYLKKLIHIFGQEKYDEIATRTLSPDIIICDEIGQSCELNEIVNGLNSGIKFVLTAHASSLEEFKSREVYKKLFVENNFKKAVFLVGCNQPCAVSKIYDFFEMKDENNDNPYNMYSDCFDLRKAN